MQDEKEHLKRSVTRSVFFICFLVFPSTVGLVVLAPLLIKIIPRYGKWEPALIPLTLIVFNTVFAAITTQLTNLLNAIGKIKITFKLMIMWTILSWLTIPILAIKYGVVGAAGGYALVGASSVVAISIARRFVDFSLVESAYKPALSSIVMGIFLYILRGFLPTSLYSVWIIIAVGLIVYLLAVYFIVGKTIGDDIKKTLTSLFSR